MPIESGRSRRRFPPLTCFFVGGSQADLAICVERRLTNRSLSVNDAEAITTRVNQIIRSLAMPFDSPDPMHSQQVGNGIPIAAIFVLCLTPLGAGLIIEEK